VTSVLGVGTLITSHTVEVLTIEVVAAASDQENLVTNDSEPAGPLSAINEVRASAVDEVRPFRQERGPKNLHVCNFSFSFSLC
jgi:hypothetical protein